MCERSAEKVLRLSPVNTQLAPASPVFSWLVVSLTIVIWLPKIAQLEPSPRASRRFSAQRRRADLNGFLPSPFLAKRMKALAGAVVHTGHEASPTLRLTFRNEGLLMAHYGELCIAIWSQKPTRATFEVQQAELKAAVGRSPGRAHFMCVVGVGSDPPDPEIRSASSQMINAQGARLASCACVIEGSGFRAALARTALSGIALLVRSPTPLKFFEGISSAALWQQERGARGSMAQLISGLRTLRDAERR